jgi:hypothetical protein
MKPEPRIDAHLEPEDFLTLALPPAGEPEGLPTHLSACAECARRLAEWRRAAAAMAQAPEGPDEDFERRVMEKVRARRAPRRGRSRRRWAAASAAAAAVLAALWLGTRIRTEPSAPPRPVAAASASAELPEADRADDQLLRDVAELVSGEDAANWKSLAPLPESSGGKS